MAGHAGGVERFIFDELQSVSRNLLCLVAGRTGHFGMCAVEYKSRITLMIKPGWLPIIGSMTPFAICAAISTGINKLSAMDIFVTAGTGRTRICKRHMFRCEYITSIIMALETCRGLMLAGKREFGLLMIEHTFIPRAYGVAPLTTVGLDKLVDLSFVRILVAGIAFG